MTPTTCRQRDCLCFHVRVERVGYSPKEIFCVANISDPRTQWCEQYRPPSWKPKAAFSQIKRKGF